MFQKEPYIIFTYRLYDAYHQLGDELTDKFVSDMKEIYTHPERILIPNSLAEFEEILKEVDSCLLKEKVKLL